MPKKVAIANINRLAKNKGSCYLDKTQANPVLTDFGF
jgi:hypothetical protein